MCTLHWNGCSLAWEFIVWAMSELVQSDSLRLKILLFELKESQKLERINSTEAPGSTCIIF
jgi:hypothetical protein